VLDTKFEYTAIRLVRFACGSQAIGLDFVVLDFVVKDLEGV